MYWEIRVQIQIKIYQIQQHKQSWCESNMTNELYFSMILTLHSAEPEVGYQPEWFPTKWNNTNMGPGACLWKHSGKTLSSIASSSPSRILRLEIQRQLKVELYWMASCLVKHCKYGSLDLSFKQPPAQNLCVSSVKDLRQPWPKQVVSKQIPIWVKFRHCLNVFMKSMIFQEEKSSTIIDEKATIKVWFKRKKYLNIAKHISSFSFWY